MAITLTYSPYSIASAYQNIKFKVTSDATANDLKIRALVQYSRDGSNWTSLGYQYAYKEADAFVIDIANRISSVLKSDFVEDANSFLDGDTPNSIVAYRIIFTERYANNLGLQESFATLQTAVFYAINGQYKRSETQSLHGYLLQNDASPFLTHSPSIQNIRAGETIQLAFITEASPVTAKIFIKKDVDATQTIDTVNLANNRGVLFINADDYLSPDLQYFEVWIEDGEANAISERKRFVWSRTCSPNEYRLAWLNEKGGFDHYTFLGADEEVFEFEKTTYKNYLPDNYTTADAKNGVFSSIQKQVITVNSLWETLESRRWLTSLFWSKEVYWIKDGQRYAIQILNTEYITKQSRQLLQVPVQFELDEDGG